MRYPEKEKNGEATIEAALPFFKAMIEGGLVLAETYAGKESDEELDYRMNALLNDSIDMDQVPYMFVALGQMARQIQRLMGQLARIESQVPTSGEYYEAYKGSVEMHKMIREIKNSIIKDLQKLRDDDSNLPPLRGPLS